MTYPIVIPLHHGGGKFKNNTELKFALRSLAKHFKDECEIAIVGRRLPEWAQGVRHIESREGLKTALADAAKVYPEGFFWWYDDLCLLKDTTGEEMKVTPACRGWCRPKTGWSRRLDEIRQRLVAEGRPAWDYSRPHGPYWFDQAMVEEGFADWPGMKAKFPWESWILSKRDWPRRHGVVKQYYGVFKGAPGDGAHFVNYNDKGNTGELRDFLESRFPEHCCFERPLATPSPESNTRVQAIMIALPQRPRWEAQGMEDLKAWGIDVMHFPGIDGHDPAHEKVVPVNAEAFRRSFKHEPLPGEIGCFCSHIKIAKAALDLPPLHPSQPEWRLVLEDDAVSVGMTGDKLCAIANMATEQGYDLVMLHTGRRNRRGGEQVVRISPTKGKDIFTHAYIATLGALKEMTGWEMRHPIDHAISRARKIRVGVLWGSAQFTQRLPSTSTQSIHRERKAAYGGRSISYGSRVAVKKIHQVWVQGAAALPTDFAANRNAWKEAFPDFELILWDEAMAASTWADYAENSAKCFHHATRADLILARALRDFGGLATGTDCRPNNPAKLRALIETVDSLVVLTPGRSEISNGLQWSAHPGHPFWKCVCNHQLRQRGQHLSRRSVSSATGPKCYMEAFQARKWELFVVTAPAAFTRDWNNEWTNSEALIDPGFAASWLKPRSPVTPSS